MVWQCKALCELHRVIGRYDNDILKCSVCDVFIKTRGIRCPCCGVLLKRMPKALKSKVNYLQRKGLEIKRI